MAKLEISQLDFDNIKNNLKRFLSNQNQFKDYDFEGSGMAVLLDLLAYNTHYLSYNANVLANEMFIDTADLRPSIISLAKALATVFISKPVLIIASLRTLPFKFASCSINTP